MAKRVGALRFAVSRSNGGPALLDGARAFTTAIGLELGFAVDLVVTYDYSALLKAILHDHAELAWMPPLMHARAAAQGARLLALCKRGGALGYRSALVVHGERYRALRDLVGVRAAWVDRSSSSGYLFPRLHLLAAGIDPAIAFLSERFCGSATHACELVASGEADLAACFLGTAHDRSSAQREIDRTFNTRGALRVLDVTAQIPPDGFVLGAAVDDSRANALRAALLRMHERPEGRAALKALLQAESLAPVSAEVVAALQRLVAYAARL